MLGSFIILLGMEPKLTLSGQFGPFSPSFCPFYKKLDHTKALFLIWAISLFKSKARTYFFAQKIAQKASLWSGEVYAHAFMTCYTFFMKPIKPNFLDRSKYYTMYVVFGMHEM